MRMFLHPLKDRIGKLENKLKTLIISIIENIVNFNVLTYIFRV